MKCQTCQGDKFVCSFTDNGNAPPVVCLTCAKCLEKCYEFTVSVAQFSLPIPDDAESIITYNTKLKSIPPTNELIDDATAAYK